MEYNTLEVTLTNNLLSIFLNRPERLNALNIDMMAELITAIDYAKQEDSVRAVLVSGNGRGFCAGADLGVVNTSFDKDKRRAQGNATEAAMHDYFNRIASGLGNLPKPVIAAVNGVAAGGGMGLALSADMVFAAESALFTQVFLPQLGIVPDTSSTWTLPRLVGQARARGLMLTGDKITAKQAEDWGMIWKCVPNEALMETATQAAQQLAQGATFGIGLTKQALAASDNNSLDEQLALEAQLNNRACGSYDFVAGVRAFLNKKAPQFCGLEDGE